MECNCTLCAAEHAEDSTHRAFVEGAAWWQWYHSGRPMCGNEQDRAEKEAIRRYGEPEPEEGT